MNNNKAEIKMAWQRGCNVHRVGHQLSFYARALAAYSEAERTAFMAVFNDQPCPEPENE